MSERNIKIICLFLISNIIIYVCFIKNNFRQEEYTKETIPVITEQINKPFVDYEGKLNKLKEEYNNNDIVGILSIENTDFSELIVQTTDNDYYLENSIYKQSDWRGQAFLDYRVDINDSKKILIYGHNAPNISVPFKFLENYYNSEYLNEHKYIYLQTDKEIYKYEIFSVYVEISDWSYYTKINFNSEEEYYNHILKLRNSSFYETGTNLSKDDNILIIQTCSYLRNYINYENKFLLVIAKKL